MEEQPIMDQIEALTTEEHALWRAESDGSLDEAGHERLATVRRELEHAWETLRRRRAGLSDEGPTDADVPDPPNDLDGVEPEPPHSEHGVHDANA